MMRDCGGDICRRFDSGLAGAHRGGRANMARHGRGNGEGGEAVLMNTPSFISRATAQMAEGHVKVAPTAVDELHARVVAGNLIRHETRRLSRKAEGKRSPSLAMAISAAKSLSQGLGMKVAIHARPWHQEWIESEDLNLLQRRKMRRVEPISPARTRAWALMRLLQICERRCWNEVLAAMNDGGCNQL
jgi:hypothetical protein